MTVGSDPFSEGLALLDMANENVDLRRALVALLDAVRAEAWCKARRTAEAVALAIATLQRYAPDDPRARGPTLAVGTGAEDPHSRFAHGPTLAADPAHEPSSPASIDDDGDPG